MRFLSIPMGTLKLSEEFIDFGYNRYEGFKNKKFIKIKKLITLIIKHFLNFIIIYAKKIIFI